jgi:tetratricopeptide (TPR) repeat protein
MASSAHVTQLLREGIAAAQAGRTEKARQALLQVTELDDRNEQAWLWLSGVVASFEERRVCLENVLALNPQNTHAQKGLCWLDEQAGPPATTQERCPRCQTLVPRSGTACPHCGQPLIVACPACGQYADVKETACPECGQVLGDFHQGAPYYLALARAYLERQQSKLAQEFLARAETEAANDPRILGDVAALYAEMGHTDQAIAAYEQAIEHDPENAILYTRLGAIYHQRAMPTKARAMVQQAIERSGDDPVILFESARLCVEQDGATTEALKLLDRAVRRDSKHVQARLLLADVCLDLGRQKQATQHCAQACALTAPDSEIGQKARRKWGELRTSHHKQSLTRNRRDAAPSGAAYSRPRERPGCVTAYAVLLGIGACMIALGGIIGGTGLMSASHGSKLAGQTVIVLTIILAMLYFLFARGLWNLKNWARIIVIVTNALGEMSNLFAVIRALSGSSLETYGYQGDPTAAICGSAGGLVVGAYVLYWFIAHREYFD